jgi:hypothetical protein
VNATTAAVRQDFFDAVIVPATSPFLVASYVTEAGSSAVRPPKEASLLAEQVVALLLEGVHILVDLVLVDGQLEVGVGRGDAEPAEVEADPEEHAQTKHDPTE